VRADERGRSRGCRRIACEAEDLRPRETREAEGYGGAGTPPVK
jgi:hypothetical protein